MHCYSTWIKRGNAAELTPHHEMWKPQIIQMLQMLQIQIDDSIVCCVRILVESLAKPFEMVDRDGWCKRFPVFKRPSWILVRSSSLAPAAILRSRNGVVPHAGNYGNCCLYDEVTDSHRNLS